MGPQSDATVHLETFEGPVAQAVVRVLRRHGVAAWTNDVTTTLAGLVPSEVVVLVPKGRREEALAILSASMEEVREEVTGDPTAHSRGFIPTGGPRPFEDEDGPPIVMEQLRRMGFLALVLAPLLIVTLAVPRLPLAYAIAIFIGGLVAVSAWRNRQEEQRLPDPPDPDDR